MSLPCTPAVAIENDLSIEQRIDGIDSCTCQLNTFFNSLVSLLNTLDIDGSINIDINSFIDCTESLWNRPEYVGLSGDDRTKITKSTTDYYNGPAGNGLTDQQKQEAIAKTLDNANIAMKILQWISSGRSLGTTTGISRTKTIPIKITCSDTIQVYTDKPPYNCSKECTVDIPIILVARDTTQSVTIAQLMTKLQKGYPISCAIDPSPAYMTNLNSDDNSNEIIATITDFSQNLGYSIHAVSCIGFECDGDYVIFTFKDSFEYGTTIKRPGIFKVRVHKNIQDVPFGVGNLLGTYGGKTRFLYCVFPSGAKSRIEKSIKDMKEKCCPTPTPEASSSSSSEDPWDPGSSSSSG